ncbi:pentapeptide repeat-containing protein [Micromonospora sp. NPDC003197]
MRWAKFSAATFNEANLSAATFSEAAFSGPPILGTRLDDTDWQSISCQPG